MKAKKLILIGVAGVAASLPVASRANLVVDGTFTGPLTGVTMNGPGYTEVGAGGSIGGAWAVTSGSVDVIDSYWQAPPGGGNSVDMAGIQNGAIAQTTINAQNAGLYMLSFYLSGNPDGPPELKQLAVVVNGGAPVDYSYDIVTQGNTRGNMKYVLESELVSLQAGANLLSFADISGPAPGWGGATPWGSVVGNVQLTAVPEPTTMVASALLLLPMGASAIRILRRNRLSQ
jgi:hypothetical protein